MRSYLEYMASSLKEYQPVVEIHRPMCKRVRMITRYADAVPPYQQDILYCMDRSEIEAAELLPPQFIYFSQVPLSISANANWLCLRREAPNERIVQALSDVQIRYDRYLGLLESLVSVMADKDMIQKMADLCYEFWDSPISLHDTSFKLLASSSQYRPSDARARDVVHTGYMSVDAVKALKKQDRLKVYLSRDRYKITKPDDIAPEARIEGQNCGYIDVPVRAQGKVIACLALICTAREPDEMDADCLCEVAQFVSLALQRDGLYMQNAENPFEALFHDVLSGSLREADVIEARLISLGKKLKKQKRIAVIPLGETSIEGSTEKSDALQSDLRGLLPGAITAWYQGNIVLLLSDADKVVLEKDNSRLSTYVKINGLHVGISRQFTSLTSIPESYQQALAALRLGTRFYPELRFFSYDEYVLTHELEILSRNADLKSFCLPALLELARSSKRGDKELLTTLYYYITYAKDQSVICDLLHIHRSTLFYRINKIQEMIGIDLNDSLSAYMVMNSFHILRYTGQFAP